MGKDDKEPSSGLQSPGIFWIAALAVGLTLMRVLPLETSRPVVGAADVTEHVSGQDVDARLWQDPIGAVGRERKLRMKAAASSRDAANLTENKPRPIEKFASDFKKRCEPLDSPPQDAPPSAPEPGSGSGSADPVFLAVMVQGGPYPEDAEARRRTRYAVVAAMARSGYVAADPDHLGYFEPDSKATDAGKPSAAGSDIGKPGAQNSDDRPSSGAWLPEFIVYEEFQPDQSGGIASGLRDTSAKAQGGRIGRSVFLLWLDDTFFVEEVAKKMAWLAPRLVGKVKCRETEGKTAAGTADGLGGHFVVLGPTSSYGLRQMAADKEKRFSRADRLIFYSYNATVSHEEIIRAFKALGNGASPLGADPSNNGPALQDLEQASNGNGEPSAPISGAMVSKLFVRKHGFWVYRTVASDTELARRLARELALRGVEPARTNVSADHDKSERRIGPGRLPGSAVAATQGAQLDRHASCARSMSRRWQHVVLIADWDTYHGRSAPQAMREGLAAGGDCEQHWIHRFSYPRGLDGRLPSSESEASGADASKLRQEQKENARLSPEPERKSAERAEGESQYDYLRRLGQRLLALDEDMLRHERGRIRVIGLLGSDVHDKLLLLQALRPQFPDAIFFTTDLDARFLDPQQFKWSRKLLVASSYGLELDPALQSSTPPFRNSYQTASYLSTLVALHNVHHGGCPPAGPDKPDDGSPCIGQARLSDWLSEPRVFEIASGAAFDLSAGKARAVGRENQWAAHDAGCSAARLDDCLAVHPEPSNYYYLPTARAIATFVLLVMFGLWAVALSTGSLNRPGRMAASVAGRGAAASPTAGPGKSRKRTKLLLAASGAVVVLAFFHGWALRSTWSFFGELLTQKGLGEPFVLGGISVWPSVAVKLLALALSVAFIAWGWWALNRNADNIVRLMGLQPARQELVSKFGDQKRLHWSPTDRLLQAFSYRPGKEDLAAGADAGVSPSAQAFWHKYIYLDRWQARMARILVVTALYSVAAYWLIYVLGEPSVPYRGSLSGSIERFSYFAGSIAAFFLIWFVVDATYLCSEFIRELWDVIPQANGRRELILADRVDQLVGVWPKAIVDEHAERLGMPGRYIEPWLTLRCIEWRTRLVGSLVYLPFIVLSLMIVSHSVLFYNWRVPLGLSIVIGCSVFILAGCAVLLRTRAEKARQRAVRTLKGELTRLRAQDDPGARRLVEQIPEVIERIQSMRAGALGPYSQQPVFRALLLPFATYGGTFVLEYLTVMNV